MIEFQDVLTGTAGTLYRRPGGMDTGQPPASFSRVGIDSRTIEPGDLFVAVRGEVQDGHRFVLDAARHGAAGAIVACGRAAEFAAAAPALALIEVAEPLTALGALAAYWRRKFTIPVVGITGSVGKSSTKELAAGVLGTRLKVLKSPKSYNNEFGLPLSVLLIEPETEVAVLEMGTYGPGELTALSRIAQQTIAAVTNIGYTHLERMGTREVIAQAKGELVAALPLDGVAVLNGDDPRVRPMAELTQARTIFYGQGGACALRATDVVDHGLAGLSFNLIWQDETERLDHVPLRGAHSVYTALATAGIALAVGLPFADVVEGLRREHASVRLVVVPGRNGATIIDDSYNAAPESALAALAILAATPSRRRLAVLGDMLELGAYEEEGHRIVGRRVAELVDELLTIGPRARIIADEARRSGLPANAIASFDRKDEVVAALAPHLGEGDTVLIKGSRGLALEDVVTALREPVS
ncbi:MAG: UDP-N-acetylmuramoyl-tripeptide--D-alanyl-D-alanine ligase [Thermomicrobiales bacterium]